MQLWSHFHLYYRTDRGALYSPDLVLSSRFFFVLSRLAVPLQEYLSAGLQRQDDADARTASRLVADADAAVVRDDNLPHERETSK
jgi:hypothetical protein